MECKACGEGSNAGTPRRVRSNLTCPPNPCCLPVVAEALPKVQVNPCPPPPAQAGPDCCNVCVPVITPAPISSPCKPRKKYRYLQPARPKSYAPERKYVPPASKMNEETIYRKSYIPAEADRPEAIRPDNNLCVGEGKMSDDTVHNMSYLPHKVLPPCPIYPCEHRLLGEGPMQDLTTQKHDFVPKPFSKPEAIRPIVNLFSNDCPLSDKTVNRLSYMPIEKLSKVEPFYPTNAIEKPNGKISHKTVHNMSYQPWERIEPIETPWADKPRYQPPKLRMDDNTVHKMSFMPPGQYIECDDNDPNCVDGPEPPCDPHSVPNYQCCQPCCCPKAAC